MNPFLRPIFYPYFEKYPLRFVDVGASGGIPPYWKQAQRFLHTIAFEPDPREFESLKRNADVCTTYINAALHREKTTADFYLTQKQEVSSLLSPNRKFLDQFPEASRFDVRDKITIEADTLDHQLKRAGIFYVDFIKLDTQGSELKILEGARESIHQVFGLEIEIEFQEIYEGQPRFSEIEQFLRPLGFMLFDLKPYFWKRKGGVSLGGSKGQLIFADALFLKEKEVFAQYLHTLDLQASKSKLLRALAISFIYGYIDYAQAMFEAQREMFNSDEQDTMKAVFLHAIPWLRRIPNVKGRGKLAAFLARLAEIAEPAGWAKTARRLGNL